MKKEQIKKLEASIPEKIIDTKNNEEKFINKCCNSEKLFNKKLFLGCVLSALGAVISVFVVMKLGFSHQDQKIQEMSDRFTSIDSKINALGESISKFENDVKSVKSEIKAWKDNSSYVYTSLSALQKDLNIIKKELHIKIDNTEESTKNLSTEHSSFIENLENLINGGAPFDSFLTSYSDKIDIKKYTSSSELLKFKDSKVKSIGIIQKDFAAIGSSIFEIEQEEGFWKKQKRVIKEKIIDAIKIRKTDDKAEVIDDNMNDKELFEKAKQFINDGDIENSYSILEKIKLDHKELGNLRLDVKNRVILEKAFNEFKKEFIERESKD